MRKLPPALLALTAALVFAAHPALADVKAGVDAWSNGDFNAAVKEWREPAKKGDPDAQFNMAQAYKLGRGRQDEPGLAVRDDRVPHRGPDGGRLPRRDAAGLPYVQQRPDRRAEPPVHDEPRDLPGLHDAPELERRGDPVLRAAVTRTGVSERR